MCWGYVSVDTDTVSLAAVQHCGGRIFNLHSPKCRCTYLLKSLALKIRGITKNGFESLTYGLKQIGILFW
jgi:hypothetical protein